VDPVPDPLRHRKSVASRIEPGPLHETQNILNIKMYSFETLKQMVRTVTTVTYITKAAQAVSSQLLTAVARVQS
jgi:hypothetical protein